MAKEVCIANPLLLMMRYLHGKPDLSNDEREILLFALYMESSKRGGLAAEAIKELRSVDTKVTRISP